MGRLTQDLLATPHRLAEWKVSVVAMNGMIFELDTPHRQTMATLLAGIAQFGPKLISEHMKSGLATAKAQGKIPGGQRGQMCILAALNIKCTDNHPGTRRDAKTKCHFASNNPRVRILPAATCGVRREVAGDVADVRGSSSPGQGIVVFHGALRIGAVSLEFEAADDDCELENSVEEHKTGRWLHGPRQGAATV